MKLYVRYFQKIPLGQSAKWDVGDLPVNRVKHRFLNINACKYFPNNKVHGAHMGSIWGRQHPGGPHVGPMNFAIWVQVPFTCDWNRRK